ncbi:hypothetical protein EB118_17575 [bacterium]|nr:hypothetical protein [bacterium]NDG31869.1 hypothetical protein [bacterium]
MKKLLMALAVLCAAPSYAQQPSSDGYFFRGDPKPVRVEFTVKVVEHLSRKDLRKTAESFGIKHSDVHAFSVIDGNVCTIHIIKPAKIYLPEHIGHELVHCIYGNWHK